MQAPGAASLQAASAKRRFTSWNVAQSALLTLKWLGKVCRIGQADSFEVT